MQEELAKTALIVGASGLVGRYCLQALLQDDSYTKVIALIRKPLPLSHPKLVQALINFDKLPEFSTQIQGTDIYCCLGTTFLKSPKAADYFKIDFVYPYEIAKMAKSKGATFIAVVSALTANKDAFLRHSQVKGQLENSISELGYKSVYFMRPSYLVGKRDEFRPIERMGVFLLKLLEPLLQGKLKKYRAIEAKVVGETMVYCSKIRAPGINIILSDDIQEMYAHRATISLL